MSPKTVDPSGSPRLQSVSLEMARWLRSRRGALGLSQEEVAARLVEEGVSISRGHYANLERANYDLRAEHVAVLDRILRGDGELIALADEKWMRVLAVARSSEWAEVGETLEASLRDIPAPHAPFDPRRAASWWEAQPANQPVVISGTEQVEEVIASLLSVASDVREPQYAPHIELAGTFFGFKAPGRAGLPPVVRQALRSAMERGRRCRHYIPTPPGRSADPMLVFVATPLIACRNFEARLVDPALVPSVENLLVIPDLVTAQFFATRNPDRIDSVMLLRGGGASRLLEDRIGQLESVGEPFVQRFERSRDKPDLTDDEANFRRLLARVSSIEGPCRMLIGWFSTATVQTTEYERIVKRRREDGRDTSERIWNEMITLQARRVEQLERHLAKGISYQTIITRDKLAKFVAGEDDAMWEYADESIHRAERLDRVLELLKKHESFEVAIATDRIAERLSACNWEVRESASGGAVVIQTRYTPLISERSPEGESDPTLPVDLVIEAPGAVAAFMAYYSRLFQQSCHDRKKVVAELVKARDALSNSKGKPRAR